MGGGVTSSPRLFQPDMSLVTVTSKRKRIYRRKFDHEQALALIDAGWTRRAVAAKFGVSVSRIEQIKHRRRDPEWHERDIAYRRKWICENARAPCAGGCGTMVWTQGTRYSGFCASCVRAIGYVIDDELMCLRCRGWKLDEEFGYSQSYSRGRRHRSSWCLRCLREYHRDRRRRGP